MAFPFILETNFEGGVLTEWTTETDTGSQLDCAHASDLASAAGAGAMAPFRGAFCARWRLGANTTDAFLTSTTIDIADAGTAFARWYMFLGTDFRATAADVVSIFKFAIAGSGTIETTIGLSMDGAGSILLGGSDGTAAASFGTKQVTLGEWHCIEVKQKCSLSDIGTLDVWLDGVLQVSATTIDNSAAIGDGILGFSDRLSTTTGTVLMDCFVFDDARIYPIVNRYPRQVLLTKSAHLFVGPGIIENASLLSGTSTDSVLTIYDTNRANTSDANKVVLELKNVTASDIVDPAGVPVQVTRGAYVTLSGSGGARALVNLGWAPGYGGAGAVRNIAGRLTKNPLELL